MFRWIPACLAWVWAAGLALFLLPWVALSVAALGAAMVPVRWLRRTRLLAMLVVGLCAPLWWWVPLHAYQDRVEALTAALDRGGPAALSTVDLAGVWSLNFAMGVVGASMGFPEVALETLMLAVPGPSRRIWYSDFAMHAPEVADAVARASRSGRAQSVAFAYRAEHAHARVALALNPVTVRVVHGEVRATVPVRYPRRYLLVLMHANGRPIGIEEGLFWALQERGWLMPYEADWRWPVPAVR
jgi:hypothetical protein